MSEGNLNGSIGVVTVAACYLCGAPGSLFYENLSDRHLGVSGVWNLRRCPGCFLIWLDPQPEPDEVGKLYVESYYTHGGDGSSTDPGGSAGLLQKAKAFLRSSNLSRLGPLAEAIEAEQMWLGGRTGGRLLDVGCGSGDFLFRMRQQGWQVEGIDPDPAAVAHAATLGLDVSCNSLLEAGLPKNSFDAVTMSHVIEHVADPIELMTESGRILKPGGLLVVVTPNTKSLGRRIFRGDWYPWETPRHLMLFAPEHLKLCAARAGLRVEKLATPSRAARGMWHLSRILQRKGSLPADHPPALSPLLRLEGLAFWLVEYLLSRWRPLGEEILLIAVKPES